MSDGVLRRVNPSQYRMESDKVQFYLPVFFVFILTAFFKISEGLVLAAILAGSSAEQSGMLMTYFYCHLQENLFSLCSRFVKIIPLNIQCSLAQMWILPKASQNA